MFELGISKFANLEIELGKFYLISKFAEMKKKSMALPTQQNHKGKGKTAQLCMLFRKPFLESDVVLTEAIPMGHCNCLVVWLEPIPIHSQVVQCITSRDFCKLNTHLQNSTN